MWRHNGVRRTVVVTFDYTAMALLEVFRRQLERSARAVWSGCVRSRGEDEQVGPEWNAKKYALLMLEQAFADERVVGDELVGVCRGTGAEGDQST